MTTEARQKSTPVTYIKERAGGLSVLRQGGMALLCALCAGTGVLGGIYPLGMALVIAAGEKYAFAAAAGLVISCGISMDLTLASRYFAAVAIVCLLKMVFGAAGKAHRPFLFTASCGAGALFLLGVLYGALRHAGIAVLAQYLAEGMIVFGLSVVYRLFFEAVEEGRRLHEFTREEIACAGLLLAAALASLTRFSPLGINLGIGLGAAAVCTAAVCRGEKCAAMTAAVVALAVTAGHPELCFSAVCLIVAAVAAGLFFPGARISIACVFAACGLFSVFIAPDVYAAGLYLAAHLLGCALSLCVPTKLLSALRAETALAGEGEHLPARISGRLYDLSAALKQVGETMEQVHKLTPAQKSGEEEIYQKAAEKCCKQCKAMSECWVTHYSDTVEELSRLTRIAGEKGEVDAADLSPFMQKRCTSPARLCGAVNRSSQNQLEQRAFAARAAHMRTVLQEQYGAVADTLDLLAGEVFREDMLDNRRSAKLIALFEELGLAPSEGSVVVDRWGRVRANVHIEKVSLSDEQLDELALEVGRRCRTAFQRPQVQQRGGVTAFSFQEKAVFLPAFGIAGSAASGDVCGDVARSFCDARGNAHLLLCDGMGTGKAAAVDGMLSVTLLKDLLAGGFAPDEAARLCTAALSLREDGESGSGMDLCSVNLYTGKSILYKAGAAFSIVLRDGRPTLYERAGLPLGIAGARAAKSVGVSLRQGDLIVLMSDGVADTGSSWILADIQTYRDKSAKELAQLLLQGAKTRSADRRDDLTVAVLKLGKN